MYKYVCRNVKRLIHRRLPLDQTTLQANRKYRSKIQPQTRDFSRLTGNHRRERSAAFEVNLLACRMRNRRQTAAPGASYDIFHSYLYFIARVAFPLTPKG